MYTLDTTAVPVLERDILEAELSIYLSIYLYIYLYILYIL
jgi:hypothetical protein